MADSKTATAAPAPSLAPGIRTVAVVGCGLMGSGIAQIAAQTGYATIVHEQDAAFLAKGRGRIEKFLDGGVAKGKLSAEDRDATLARLTGTTALADLAAADLVIEAVTENAEVKKQVFRTLHAVCGPDTLFASNTSSISI